MLTNGGSMLINYVIQLGKEDAYLDIDPITWIDMHSFKRELVYTALFDAKWDTEVSLPSAVDSYIEHVGQFAISCINSDSGRYLYIKFIPEERFLNSFKI
jgi:hypothetical protein